MKKTQRKDAFRTIKKQKASWLSIVIIAILAVSIFLGLHFSSIALTRMGNRYYDDSAFRDAEIISTMLFTEEDLAAIEETEGVAAAETLYRTSGCAINKKLEIDVNILSLTEEINTPIVVDGQLPTKANECAIDEYLAKDKFEVGIGDTIVLRTNDSNSTLPLTNTTYTITALIRDADNLCATQTLSGTRSVFVTQEAFDLEKTEGCYPWVLVRFDNTEGLNRFSKEYQTAASQVLERLRALADERSALRYEDVKSTAQKEIDEKQQELDDAAQKLADGKKELEDGRQKIAEAETKAADLKKELDDGKALLDQAGPALANAKATLDGYSAQLNDAYTQLMEGKEMLDEGQIYLNTLKEELDSSWAQIALLPPEQAAEARKNWEVLRQEYLEQLELYESGRQYYLQKLAEYETASAQLSSKYAEYESSLQQYNDGLAKYESGLQTYQEGMQELETNKQKLADAEKEYEDGLKKYEDALPEMEDAKQKVADMKTCQWIVLGAEENPSYVNLKTNIQNVKDIGNSFALVFLIVAVLVIYSTVGKTVEDQRKIVGTSKALGLLNRECFGKYLTFGLSATISGILLGILFGHQLIQRIILRAYSSFYVVSAPLSFDPVLTVIIFVAVAILSALAIWIACTVLLRSTAISLMQDQIPLKMRKTQTRKSLLPLKTRLVLQNMWTDKKRILITIISIMGCCLLITAGLSIRSSIRETIDIQFSDFFKYQLKVVYDKEDSETVEEDVSKVLSEAGTEFTKIYEATRILTINDRIYSVSLVCGDLEELNTYFTRMDPDTGKVITEAGNGIWLNEKTAELSGIKAGDEITLYDAKMNPYTVPVAGLFKEYLGNEAFLPQDSYIEIFGRLPADNTFLVMLNGTRYDDKSTAEEIAKASSDPEQPVLYAASLKSIPGVNAVGSQKNRQANYTRFVSIMDYIALLMTIMAIVMAYFILLNLVNMYINQKKKELLVMRINGFTIGEIRRYILQETYFTTAIGILLGLVAGTLLCWNTLKLAEGAGIHLIQEIQPLSCLFAALITLVFTVIVYLFALRKIGNLKLTDID